MNNSSNKDIGFSVNDSSGRNDTYYNCTPSKLEDELVLLLSSKYDAEVVEDDEIPGQIHICFFRPYLNQAEGLIYRINIYDPLPELVIWIEDIPEELARALKRLGKLMMNRVITDVIRRIYESLDQEYFHTNGIYGKVRWRFGKKKSDSSFRRPSWRE